ncbi:MAG: DUF3179 domain-containing protein, partial [Sphingomonadales bacterium]|nr:DUF3179 domain-containing protein [Sphingomonadales bacterium]
LKTRPVVITTWADWKARHPDTKILALETGHQRDYSSGAAYGPYFASPALMFPTNVDQSKLKQKDFVFALRSSGAEKAWPLKLFEGGAVVNDRAGMLELVLIGDAATRTVRAYRSEGLILRRKRDSIRSSTALRAGGLRRRRSWLQPAARCPPAGPRRLLVRLERLLRGRRRARD